jgi:hypothetical protein
MVDAREHLQATRVEHLAQPRLYLVGIAFALSSTMCVFVAQFAEARERDERT